MALDLDPTHLPTLAALRTIAIDESDWDRAARYLEQEQSNTQAPRARAKLLVELGKLRDEMLCEHELAVQAYELAIQSDPDSEEAALPLVEEYIRTERWQQAEPLAELLVKKSKNRERQEQHMLHKLLGKVQAALGAYEKALKAYTTANQLDLTDQETIRGIADVAFQLQDWPTALTNYQKVLTALGEDDTRAAHGRLLPARLHQARAGPGEAGHQQLREGARPRPAITGRRSKRWSTSTRRSNDWKQVAAYKRQILDSGDRRRGALQDPQRDRRHLGRQGKEPAQGDRGARGGPRPQARPITSCSTSCSSSTSRPAEWQQMIDTLSAIAELETRPEIKSALHLHAGADLPRQARGSGSRGRALQRGARSEPELPRGLRAHQQDPDAAEELEAARARVPQDASPHRRQGEHATSSTRSGTSSASSTAIACSRPDAAIEAFKMASRHQARVDRLDAPDPRRALRGRASAGTTAIAEQRIMLDADPLTIDPYTRALPPLPPQAVVRRGLVPGARRWRSCARRTTRRQRFFEDYRPQGMLAGEGPRSTTSSGSSASSTRTRTSTSRRSSR